MWGGGGGVRRVPSRDAGTGGLLQGRGEESGAGLWGEAMEEAVGCRAWHPQTLPSDCQQMGVSREQTQPSGNQEPRDQADGKWGVGPGWHKGPLPQWGGAGWASSPPGLPSSQLFLMPHWGFLEALREPYRFWGQAWAAGERRQGCERSLGHTIPDPCPVPVCPSSPTLSLVPGGLA